MRGGLGKPAPPIVLIYIDILISDTFALCVLCVPCVPLYNVGGLIFLGVLCGAAKRRI
jgi:hypothetical protein